MSQEQNKDMSQYFYRASAADFMKIPGSPVAYWVSEKIRSAFQNKKINDIGKTRVGLQTGDNSRFVRLWHECELRKTNFDCQARDDSKAKHHKWFPYNKGGQFRRWYGNQECLVNWENDGCEIFDYARNLYGSPTRTVKNAAYYFLPSVTWSKISSGAPSFRWQPLGAIFDVAGASVFYKDENFKNFLLGMLNSKFSTEALKVISPTLNFETTHIAALPVHKCWSGIGSEICSLIDSLIEKSKYDWDAFETSWGFKTSPIITEGILGAMTLQESYSALRKQWADLALDAKCLEEANNRIFIDAYGLQDELTPEVQLKEITLTCNPHYRYGGDKSEVELETLLQCDTLRELVSYAIGCMMGRYSLDKPGLILASQGETLQDYLRQIPAPRFTPDDDAILPLTDQEWFADDATNRFREFIRTVWGEQTLQENLDFVAESLCLHAIKPKKGEASLETIRRYLSTQFFKDHLRTYKKRPIYWLFSSGKHKAFECLVYLHRYNEGTLARMRTEYVIPLTAKLSSYAAKLEKDIEASNSTAEKKRLEKELTTLHNQQAELATFDETLRHYADQRISLDLDDGVKVNYGKFGDLLAEVKAVTGDKSSD